MNMYLSMIWILIPIFFIRDPGCPDYFDYADHSYSNNILTITLDEFHQKDAACPAAIYQVYLVFKAEKNS